jgi:hypothetical protein
MIATKNLKLNTVPTHQKETPLSDEAISPELTLFDESGFYLAVEALVAGGENYIDACYEYCQRRHIEVEAIADLIIKSPDLRAKITRNAEDLKFIRKTIRIQIYDVVFKFDKYCSNN